MNSDTFRRLSFCKINSYELSAVPGKRVCREADKDDGLCRNGVSRVQSQAVRRRACPELDAFEHGGDRAYQSVAFQASCSRAWGCGRRRGAIVAYPDDAQA